MIILTKQEDKDIILHGKLTLLTNVTPDVYLVALKIKETESRFRLCQQQVNLQIRYS